MKKGIALIVAIALLPVVVNGAWQVKWVFNYTSMGLRSPAWFSTIYADLDGDRLQEIITNPGEERLAAVKGNGQLAWVFPPLGNPGETSVGKFHTIADVDLDGKMEIIMGSSKSVYCLGPQGEMEWKFTLTEDRTFSYVQPSLVADLDSDGDMEVVVASHGNVQLIVLDHTGKELWRVATIPPGRGVDSMISAFDFDKDGLVEILVQSRSVGEGPTAENKPGTLMVYDGKGTEKFRWSTAWCDWLHNQPVIADINADNEYEIVFGTRHLDTADYGGVVALTFYGAEAWRWNPGTPKEYMQAEPLAYDFDGDGKKEIAVVCRNGGAYLLSSTGQKLWRYDYLYAHQYNTLATLAGDIDGDGKVEIVFDTRDNKTIIALDSNGKLKTSYRYGGLQTTAPAMGDMDGDGKLDIVIFSKDQMICMTMGAAYNKALLPWPMQGVDAGRSAVVPIPESMLAALLLCGPVFIAAKRR